MENENLQIVVSSGNRDGQKIMRLKGPLNIKTVFGFQATVRAEDSPSLILDFTGVPFIDSAGLGALVGAYVAAQKVQRKLVVAGMGTQVKALIEMTKVSQLIKAYETVAEAEEAL
ncbi:MAG TPA: STAS domain-containing protein [Candidatus Acidoferrales bacterium]|jgi:anti-sigma B factor antagonist|nr:STAS domain-containing protein [Candidatus Acidoferrales bacterium]